MYLTTPATFFEQHHRLSFKQLYFHQTCVPKQCYCLMFHVCDANDFLTKVILSRHFFAHSSEDFQDKYMQMIIIFCSVFFFSESEVQRKGSLYLHGSQKITLQLNREIKSNFCVLISYQNIIHASNYFNIHMYIHVHIYISGNVEYSSL